MQAKKQFVVTCKRCLRDVPSGTKEFPFQSIPVSCQLCGEQRKYLPSEVFFGHANHLVAKQGRARVSQFVRSQSDDFESSHCDSGRILSVPCKSIRR